jgi:hypothetical protein
MRKLILQIIDSLRNKSDNWICEQDCLDYITEDGNVVSIKIGKLFRVPSVYFNCTRIPIFRPILRLRLRLAIRRYLIKQAQNVLTNE